MSSPSPIFSAERPLRQSVLREFLSDRRGAVAIEYGLVLCLVAVAILASLTQLNGAIKPLYDKVVAAVMATS